MLRCVLRPMVKYGLADQVALCIILLKPPRLWLGGLVPQATDQRWLASSSSTSTSSTSSDQQSDNLPHWSSAVTKVLLVQPSSAAAERVFSILNSSFNGSQENALVDYIQACVMLH